VVVVDPVVSVEVLSVDPVVEPVLVDSGVVVVIVVTTVLPPVVTVETIVVVACAPNGAAPAVNAAAAAPSVTSTAKAAPHTAYFLYCLLISPLLVFLDYEKGLPNSRRAIPEVARRGRNLPLRPTSRPRKACGRFADGRNRRSVCTYTTEEASNGRQPEISPAGLQTMAAR